VLYSAFAQLRAALWLSTLAMSECRYLMPRAPMSALEALDCCSARLTGMRAMLTKTLGEDETAFGFGNGTAKFPCRRDPLIDD
jgi:hypothetical protein